jgi:hypothetical protein
MKLDGLTAFTKLGDKLIPKEEVMSRFPDARDAAALLGKYTWNVLEIFRRLNPFGTSIL